MILPIDARLAPFKEKYLDEETILLRRWRIFGYDPDDFSLRINDGNNDIFIGLDTSQAVKILIARDEFVQSILKIINNKL